MIELDERMLRPRRDLIAFPHTEDDSADLPEDLGFADIALDRSAVSAVLSAAMLTVTAFRLRDEAGLIVALRELTQSVVGLERAHAA